MQLNDLNTVKMHLKTGDANPNTNYADHFFADLGHCAAHAVPTRPENANLVDDGNGGLVGVQPERQRGQEKRAFLS
jgi:hypothetical protein